MARLNISVPDALHARLEALREGINFSAVCAAALERTATMAELQVAAPDIARAAARMNESHGEWHRHGREDGRAWAVDTAHRGELEACTSRGALPPGIDVDERVVEWAARDAGVTRRGQTVGLHGELVPAFLRDDEAQVEPRITAANRPAYAAGFVEAAREVWEALQPHLL